jgi:hypothetical protein
MKCQSSKENDYIVKRNELVEKKCVAYPPEDYLFKMDVSMGIHQRNSRRLKTNKNQKYH